VEFSPDERWLAVGYGGTGDLQIWSRAGGEPLVLPGKGGIAGYLRFGPRSDVLVSGAQMDVDNTTRVWTVPEGELLLAARGSSDPQWRTVAGVAPLYLSPDASELITIESSSDWIRSRIRSWRSNSEEPKELGIIEGASDAWATDPSGKELYYFADSTGKEIVSLPLDELETASPRVRAKHESTKQLSVCNYQQGLTCGTHGGGGEDGSVTAAGASGEIHFWTLENGSLEPARVLQTPTGVWGAIDLDASRSVLAAGHEEGIVGLWDLGGPPAADPLLLRFESGNDVDGVALLPSGRWLAAANDDGGLRIFPLERDYSKVFSSVGIYVFSVAFTPDGSSLVSMDNRGLIRWPLATSSGVAPWERLSDSRGAFAMDPSGGFLAQTQVGKQLILIHLADGESRAIPTPQQWARTLALSRDSRLVAWGGASNAQSRVIRVWDLESEEIRILDAGGDLGIGDLEFTPGGSLLAAHVPPSTMMQGGASSGALLRRWNLEDGSHEVLLEGVETFDLTRDGRYLLGLQDGRVILHDLDHSQTTRLAELEAEGRTVSLALDPSGKIAVTGGEDGVLRVGPVTGGDPHLLTGHEKSVLSVGVSPDGHWIASGGADGKVRLWPMPEGPPLHTLPYNEFLAKLESLTNLRVIQDEDSDTGWRVEIGPFPGWDVVPIW
jgi:WD40 repeat protein